MYEEILTDIGMTRSEIAVYFALLDLGNSTTGPIIKKAEIAAGKAYLVLDKLAKKGMVTYSITAGKKYFMATDPERLINYLEEKEKEILTKKTKLQEILPTLKAKYQEQKYQPLAEVFEGNKGFATFMESIFKQTKKGDTICIMGVSIPAFDKYNALLMEWNKKRVEKEINLKIIYNEECREYGKQRAKMPLTAVKYMPKSMETPTWIDIYGDYVATINVNNAPIIFMMKDKDSAESYRKYFEMIWENSKQ